MNNQLIQLSLNFDQNTDAHNETSEAQHAVTQETAAAVTLIVDFSTFRDQRAKAQKAEEERALMDWIRSRVEHLQA